MLSSQPPLLGSSPLLEAQTWPQKSSGYEDSCRLQGALDDCGWRGPVGWASRIMYSGTGRRRKQEKLFNVSQRFWGIIIPLGCSAAPGESVGDKPVNPTSRRLGSVPPSCVDLTEASPLWVLLSSSENGTREGLGVSKIPKPKLAAAEESPGCLCDHRCSGSLGEAGQVQF